MTSPVEYFGAKIKCLNIEKGYSARPNEKEERVFHYVKISEGSPIQILKSETDPPENYTRRKVLPGGIIANDDGNVIVHVRGASYFVDIHSGSIYEKSSLKPI